MEIIDQCAFLEHGPENAIDRIEQAARTCYKSESHKKTSTEQLIRNLIKSGHESVLEHVSMSVRFITDRGVTHELVRHRLASFSQESTRYVNYSKNDHMQFIRPVWVSEGVLGKWDFDSMALNPSDKHSLPVADWLWLDSNFGAENDYNELIAQGWPPQKARQVLNNSVKTEVVVTANVREWRHMFNLRCSNAAHPQIRDLFRSTLGFFQLQWPELFGDL